MTARRALATAAIAAAGGLSACGGDGGGAPPAGAPAGARIYADAGCGSCHTLAAAGSSGTAGSNLDERRPDAARVERWVRDGGSGMPAFAGQLGDAQVREVSRWVARVAGR